MAQFGRRGITAGFKAEIFLILVIILATKVSQVKTELPTQENCPDVQLPEGSNGTCVFSDHCSKVTCTSPPDSTGPFGHMVLTVQAYGCRQPVKAIVTLESPQLTPVKFSHTFKDDEKVALPNPPGAPVNMTQFLMVELKKNGDKVHFKLVLLFEMGVMNYNTTFLEGDLDASICEFHQKVSTTHVMTEASSPTKHSSTNGVDYHKEDHHEENCPDIELPDDSDDTCVLGDHCSKVTCASPPDSTGPFSHMVLTVQAYGCRQPVKATVTMESSQSTSVKWSHKFKDGEKAALPMKPPEAADDIKIFLKVELKKNGGKVHFKLVLLFESYNVTLLEGDLHASKCDSQFSRQTSGSKGSWFSRQSSGVKALVIVFPLLVVILLVLVLALFCYKKRKDGTRFLIDIFPGRDKFGMQRLSNDQLCNEL